MKNKNKLLLIIATLSCQLLIAQDNLSDSYPDTLTLETDSQIELTISFWKMKDQKRHLTNELWNSILGAMEAAIESSSYYEGLIVSYQKIQKDGEESAKIEVKPFEDRADVFMIGQDGMKAIRSNRIDYNIYLSEVAISFSISELGEIEHLKEINIESVWDQVSQKYENYGKRNIYRGKGEIKYGNANINKITSKSIGTDAIELSMGVGVGFYRDRFIPDLGFKLGFNLPDRFGDIKVQTGLLYTQQYIFTESGEIATAEPNVNGFLTGFFNLKYAKGNEVGLGLGLLVHEQGDFYEGTTIKVSLFTQRSNSKISFTPELIFTNDFKQAFPALKFGLSF